LPEHEAIVREVAKAVGLEEGERGVAAVVSSLARLEPVSIRRLSRAVDLPVPIVASVCGELRKRSLVAQERPARLTAGGRAAFGAGRLRLLAPPGCAECGARGLVVPAELARVRRRLVAAAEAAPSAKPELDQSHCTVETKLRRVLALYAADALAGRRVLLLGDDDLLSVALAEAVRELGSPSTVAGVSVVDADPDVLRFLRRRLRRAPFPFSAERHDLREPLPPALAGRFDTVVTDPPYTLAGVQLFLSRAVEALAGVGGSVFLSFGSRRPGADFALQETLTELGLAIRELRRDFNDYVGAGVLGGTSHLYHLRATSAARPLVHGRFDGALYTAEVAAKGAAPGARTIRA
jgi:N4-bis(aminopropyl)spermidine synthase